MSDKDFLKGVEPAPRRGDAEWARAQERATQAGALQAVGVEAVAKVVRTADGLGLDWLVEGGLAAMVEGETLLICAEKLTDESGSGEVYLSAPSGSAAFWIDPHAVEGVKETGFLYNVEIHGSSRADLVPVYLAATQPNAAPGGGQGVAEQLAMKDAFDRQTKHCWMNPPRNEEILWEKAWRAGRAYAAPGAATAAREQPKDDFLLGICVALQVVTGADHAVTWREIVRAADEDRLLQFAAHVEPEEWALAGFAKYAHDELGKGKPARLASRPEAPVDPSAEVIRLGYDEQSMNPRLLADLRILVKQHHLSQKDFELVKAWAIAAASNPRSPDAAALAGMQPVEGGANG